MNETSKTVAFIVTAAILGVAASWSYWMTQPKSVSGFEKVGQEFFPDFQDGSTAASLSVTAFDSDSDGLREFSVMLKDGLWRIPSHHDYPAEAAERLARTATSLIGVRRESIIERRANKHAEYGVVDPSDEEADPDSAGQRITLKNEAGDIISDYIIGKPAGSAADDDKKMVRDLDQDSDYYYVRVPSEKETYKAKIEIDLSTRFSDWINPDLLKLEAADINRLELDNYELVEDEVQVGNRVMTRMMKNVIDQQRLTRDGFDPWQLDGLNETTEEIDTLKIESIATLLDTMTIVGVRPKVKVDGELLVKSDLSINQELQKKEPLRFQAAIASLQRDLERKGFTIGQTSDDPTSISLLASRGEVRAATKNGVLYTLYFGRSVSGDEKEIEIGGAEASDDEAESSDAKAEEGGEKATEEGENAEGEESENEEPENEGAATENKSRYVAIRIDFDPTALGEKPVKPTEPTAPEKPEGYDEWKAAKEKRLEEASDDSKKPEPEKVEEPSDADSPPGPPQDIADANKEKFRAHEKAVADFEQAEIQFTTDVELFETAEIEYKAREATGKELAEELNERFAEWFYVVPAESLAKLKLTRADIVKLRESSPPNPNAPSGITNPGLPPAPNIQMPSSETDKPVDPNKPKDQVEGEGEDKGEEGDGKTADKDESEKAADEAAEDKNPDDGEPEGKKSEGDGDEKKDGRKQGVAQHL